MVLFLLLVLVAVALGIIGSVAKGLGYLLVIGIVPASLFRRPAQPEAGDLPAWPAGRCLAAPFGRP